VPASNESLSVNVYVCDSLCRERFNVCLSYFINTLGIAQPNAEIALTCDPPFLPLLDGTI